MVGMTELTEKAPRSENNTPTSTPLPHLNDDEERLDRASTVSAASSSANSSSGIPKSKTMNLGAATSKSENTTVPASTVNKNSDIDWRSENIPGNMVKNPSIKNLAETQGLKPRKTDQLEWLYKKVVPALMKNKHSWPFSHPVNPVLLGIPDYYEVIKHPMDMGNVKKRLQANLYHTSEDCISDLNLIFKNCFRYNPKGSDVYVMGESVNNALKDKLKTMPTPETEVVAITKKVVSEPVESRTKSKRVASQVKEDKEDEDSKETPSKKPKTEADTEKTVKSGKTSEKTKVIDKSEKSAKTSERGRSTEKKSSILAAEKTKNNNLKESELKKKTNTSSNLSSTPSTSKGAPRVLSTDNSKIAGTPVKTETNPRMTSEESDISKTDSSMHSEAGLNRQLSRHSGRAIKPPKHFEIAEDKKHKPLSEAFKYAQTLVRDLIRNKKHAEV